MNNIMFATSTLSGRCFTNKWHNESRVRKKCISRREIIYIMKWFQSAAVIVCVCAHNDILCECRLLRYQCLSRMIDQKFWKLWFEIFFFFNLNHFACHSKIQTMKKSNMLMVTWKFQVYFLIGILGRIFFKLFVISCFLHINIKITYHLVDSFFEWWILVLHTF